MALKAKLKPKVNGVRMPTKRRHGEMPEGYVYGRPTNYRPEYAEKMVQYFENATAWQLNYTDKGNAQVIPRDNQPSFVKFARLIGVTRWNLMLWARANPDFAEAYAICKELQQEFISQAAGVGLMPSAWAIFQMRANHGITDQQPDTVSDEDDSDVNVVAEADGNA
ncbi:hypothetical protein P858_41 [Edwardsiella phage eiAU-183]|uniref:Gp1 n=4 Tax=Viruses TaxID=10239 RepID=E7EKS4_9CAUD|nr:terminase [Edwardsiella phage eiAU-183]YP_009613891.1 terminase [Edwardsiella phage eiAU]ADV36484.1 gp1 [Edwardsiella phage eiDWF]ADV36533.1 gp1 [Edwardsiella phage eiMSLS]ADV36429.1 gp1 [Edwardsiella phage eiAU]AHG23457.1 hypothetical protein P858_41 [Edwardsiella phage eiAU]AHG23511.1 hypothetical protein P858_41 [Edwardsiella phage eiAU-183]